MANGKPSPIPSPSPPSSNNWPWATTKPSPLSLKAKPWSPNIPKQPINLDYIELRLLYDMDYDNTQIEPTCGDGVIQPWLGEACDDGNTKTAITVRPTAPKNSPGAATAPFKQTPAKSLRRRIRHPLVQQRLLVPGWRSRGPKMHSTEG